MNAFEEWLADNEELLETHYINPLVAEQIFYAGVISERNKTLDMIAEGVITVNSGHIIE